MAIFSNRRRPALYLTDVNEVKSVFSVAAKRPSVLADGPMPKLTVGTFQPVRPNLQYCINAFLVYRVFLHLKPRPQNHQFMNFNPSVSHRKNQ